MVPHPLAPQDNQRGRASPRDSTGGGPQWRMPPMNVTMPMLPGLEGRVPTVGPFFPGAGVDASALPEAVFRKVVELADGDTLDLEAILVRRVIKGQTFKMYGFNGQYPGPLIKVRQDATVVVRFTNRIELPTTVHWHGVRLDNRFDGVPGITQEPVQPGETFVYEVHFVDAGLYWYHPHHRGDIQQDLGLYGNVLVSAPEEDYYNPVNYEEVLMLDDLLVDEEGLLPWGRETASHTLMGRFGNQLLVNGEPTYTLSLAKGDVVRFYLTNVANTRTYNLSFGGAPIKAIASDVSRFEREVWLNSVVIAPAQRYIVEVRFDQPGEFAFENRVQGLDHYLGEFYSHVDTLGTISVVSEAGEHDYSAVFESLRTHPAVVEDIDRFRPHFDKPVDRELVMSLQVDGLPPTVLQVMAVDTAYYPPVEWKDDMPMMNWLSTGNEVTWVLREPETGRENMDIHWQFKAGDIVKIRLVNDPRSLHPMHHPIHLHGQRFLVVAQDGIPKRNLVWKDTEIVPVGSTMDILVDMSNPGDWMLHCHIAEHLEAGMKMVFTVESDLPGS